MPATLLHEEAANGEATAVDLLLLSGLNVDSQNEIGSTPLHLAARNGHEEVVQTLIDHGADVLAANVDGNTPLHAAVGMGELSCARLLLAHGADAHAAAQSGMRPIRIAAQKGDSAALGAMLDAGATLDEETAQEVFWAAVQLCESKPEEVALSADVPRLLRHVFDADMQQLVLREKQTTNVTCMQPAEEGGGYDVINDDLLKVPLQPGGRVCDGGVCCEACSRVNLPSFATHAECEAFVNELQQVIVPPLHQFSLQKCAFRDMRTTLMFVRLVERMRRAIAHEYNLRLSTVLPLQTFVSCFIGAQDKQGGLHSDESTHKEFHYSCVMYLSTQGLDFEGGTFHWDDPAPAAIGGEAAGAARMRTPLAPSRGAAIIFSSGWENMHEVDPLESGTRFAIPSFFTTCPAPPEIAAAPEDDAAIADELWRNLLVVDDVSDFRNFMARWHGLLARGHE